MVKPEIREVSYFYWTCPKCKKVNEADDKDDSYLVCDTWECEYIWDDDTESVKEVPV